MKNLFKSKTFRMVTKCFLGVAMMTSTFSCLVGLIISSTMVKTYSGMALFVFNFLDIIFNVLNEYYTYSEELEPILIKNKKFFEE